MSFMTRNDLPADLKAGGEYIPALSKTSTWGHLGYRLAARRPCTGWTMRPANGPDSQHSDSDPHSISSSMYGFMYEVEKGNIWFGTHEDGLMKFDKKRNRFDFIRAGNAGNSHEPIIKVQNMCSGNENELYLLSYGLYRLQIMKTAV
jgi:hypothetical protein